MNSILNSAVVFKSNLKYIIVSCNSDSDVEKYTHRSKKNNSKTTIIKTVKTGNKYAAGRDIKFVTINQAPKEKPGMYLCPLFYCSNN